MNIWLPYIAAGTGADVSTVALADGLRDRGHRVTAQAFPHAFELAPWLLRTVRPPRGCEVTITNTWNGFAFKRPGIPMVTVERLFVLDPALAPYKSRAQRFYHEQVIRRFVIASAKRADAVVAVSEYTANVFAERLGVPRPTVILNAVDTNFFSPAPNALRATPRPPYRLLYVGTLSRRKGSDLLAPIMRRLGSDFQLYYTGSPAAPALGRDLPHNMHALGRLNLEQVRDQYRKADLLLFPSRGEGLARCIMEALACGTPVVISNVSSMSEAVDATVGRLCITDDAAAFGAAVLSLLDNPESLTSRRGSARRRAEERFSLDRMVSDWDSLLYQMKTKA